MNIQLKLMYAFTSAFSFDKPEPFEQYDYQFHGYNSTTSHQSLHRSPCEELPAKYQV